MLCQVSSSSEKVVILVKCLTSTIGKTHTQRFTSSTTTCRTSSPPVEVTPCMDEVDGDNRLLCKYEHKNSGTSKAPPVKVAGCYDDNNHRLLLLLLSMSMQTVEFSSSC